MDERGTWLRVKEAEKVAGALRRDQVSLGMKKNQGGLPGGGDAGICLKASAEGGKPVGFPGELVSLRKGLEETPAWGMGQGWQGSLS